MLSKQVNMRNEKMMKHFFHRNMGNYVIICDIFPKGILGCNMFFSFTLKGECESQHLVFWFFFVLDYDIFLRTEKESSANTFKRWAIKPNLSSLKPHS